MNIPGLVINHRAASIVANLLIIGVYAGAAALYALDRDAYYLSVQEDQALEWSTVWAFVAASVIYVLVARQLRTAGKPIWLALALVAFCLLVALEEISWGQRLFGYQPPVYFLEYNYQQEFNFHNVVETDYRKLALTLIIAGYGVVLPLAAQFSVLKSWLR